MKYIIKDINDVSLIQIKNFLKNCTIEDLNYINRIKNDKKRIQTIVGRILLSKLLKKEYNINYYNINIIYNNNGKPFINNLNIFFNISHSDNIVICAVSENKIGVDIEKLKDINKNIINRFSSTNEKKYIYKHNNNHNKKFLQLYTLKEAYIKMIGSNVLKNHNINFKFDNKIIFNNKKNINFKLFEYKKNYIIAICLGKK